MSPSVASTPEPVAAAGDALTGVSLFLLGVAWLVVAGEPSPSSGYGVGIALVAAQSLPLVKSRRAPLAVLTVTGGAWVLYRAIGYPGSPVEMAALMSLFAVASRCPPSTTAVATVAAIGAAVAVALTDPLWGGAAGTAVVAAILALVALTGVGVHQHELEIVLTQSPAVERRRRQREREQLGRELHDVVGHALTLMLVHAELARRSLVTTPDAVGDALTVIEEQGRAAIEDMSQLLVSLDDTAPLARLDDIGALVDELRTTQIIVSLEVSDRARQLPPRIAFAVYRIVQEATTNVVRHASVSRVAIAIVDTGETLDVSVVDDGVGSGDRDPMAGGRGLAGMCERAQRLGGSLHTETAPGAGFAVRVRLPLDGDIRRASTGR